MEKLGEVGLAGSELLVKLECAKGISGIAFDVS